MATRDHHEHWDELALGHVLGGLEELDASRFRQHLAGCGQCRARVAELRSMASDLAAAEREERATQRLRTQIESRRDVEEVDDEPDRVSAVRPRRRVIVATATVAVVVAVLSLWNAHLRMQAGEMRDVLELQERTLETIGAGSVVPVQTAGDVTGVVAVEGSRVAFALASLPSPAAGERLVVWLQNADESYHVASRYTPPQLAEGRLATTIPAVDAERLVVTIESVVVPSQPAGQAIVSARLDGEAGGDATTGS